jgi:hypothetical protein
MCKFYKFSALALLLISGLLYSCEKSEVESSDNEIYHFKIINLSQLIEAKVNNDNYQIDFSLPYGTKTNSLKVEVELGESAVVIPESGSLVDFSQPVVFTVTAEDGSSKQYTAIATIEKADFICDFEDLSLSANSFWAGPDERVSFELVNLYGSNCDVYYGSFSEKNAEFSNTYNATWQSWSGFAYSNNTDRTTAGYTNQYSVYSTGGADESKNFAVAYAPEYATPITFISFESLVAVQQMQINNSTYNYLSMKNGDDYSKPFTSGDYLQLEVEGFDENSGSTGKVDVYLADFQNNKSFIMDNWTKVDLTNLGKVKKLEFRLKSNQGGVPTYFCLDNLEALKP